MSDLRNATPADASKSADNVNNGGANPATSNSVVVQFPWKLHELLDEVDPSIISWLPDAKSFKVHDKRRFTNEVLAKYFNATKYKSFQRNLNLWGFESIQEGPHKGGCYHHLFIRGNKDKCHYMSRQKIKNGLKGSISHHAKMATIVGAAAMTNGNNGVHKMNFLDFTTAHSPVMVAALRDAKTSVLTPEDFKTMSFPKKLHHVLAQPQYQDGLCWTPDGRCIRVVDPFKFLENTKAIFGYAQLASFLIELEAHGFKKVTHLGLQECYYHDLMIRGCPHLCKYIPDEESAKRFASEDTGKDLEIDQAFGIPYFAPQAPNSTIMGSPMAGVPPAFVADPTSIQGFHRQQQQQQQQQQQMAALQFMASGGIVPNIAPPAGHSATMQPMGPGTSLTGTDPSSHGGTAAGGSASNFLSNNQGTAPAAPKGVQI